LRFCDVTVVSSCVTISRMTQKIVGSRPLPAGRVSQGNNRTVSRSIETVIHDFRSSLNIIIGYSELMLDEALGKMNKEQRDSLEDILESSQSLLDLINDVSLWQDAYPGVKK